MFINTMSLPVKKGAVMKHIRSGALKILTLAMFFVPLFYSVSLAGSNMVEQLPPEYENIQGVLIAWLPSGWT